MVEEEEELMPKVEEEDKLKTKRRQCDKSGFS